MSSQIIAEFKRELLGAFNYLDVGMSVSPLTPCFGNMLILWPKLDPHLKPVPSFLRRFACLEILFNGMECLTATR